MFDGWLCMGGNEIGNNARALGYATTADCRLDWIVDRDDCDGLREALGDEPYELSAIEDAPWYDPNDEATSRFYGCYILSMKDLSSSTRTGSFTEGILNGGVPGSSRHAGRTIRVRAWLSGAGSDGLEAGMSWLDAALEAEDCGMHGGRCGAVDSSFFVSCPPPRVDVPDFTPWRLEATNLFTNPSFEAGAGEVTVYENLFTNPSFEAGSGTVEVRRNYAQSPYGKAILPPYSSPTAQTLALQSVSGTPTPNGVKTAIRITLAPDSSLGGVKFSLPVDAPGTYVVSCMVNRQSGPLTKMALAQPGAVSGVGQTFTFNLWTLVQMEFEVTAAHITDGKAVFGWRADSGAVDPAGSVFYVTEFQVALKGQESSPPIEGDTPPADPDLTASWLGTPNASESVLTGVPAAGMYFSSSQGITWQSQTADGKILKARITPGISAWGLSVSAMPSGDLTFVTRVRTPWTGTIRIRNGGTGAQEVFVPVTAGVWTDINVLTTGAGGANTGFVGRPGDGWTGGDIFEVEYLALVAGAYTGPYFDGDSPPKLRRNLVPNPGPRAPWGWGSFGVGASQDFSSGHLIATTNSDGTASFIPRSQVIGVSGSVSVSPGAPYYLRLEVKHSRGLTMELRPWFLDANGAYVTWHSGPQATDTTDWTYVEAVGTVPATAAYMGYQVGVVSNLSPSRAGDTYEVRHVTTDPGDYFDGSTEQAPGYASAWEGDEDYSPSYVYDSDFTTSWTGAPNASTSKVAGVSVAGVVAFRGVAIRSTRWKKSGEYSARIIPDPALAAVTAAGLQVVAPVSLTTQMVTTYIEEPLVGSIVGRLQRYAPAVSDIRPNTPGEHEHRLVSDGVSSPLLQVWGGAVGGGDMWVDHLAAIEGDYTGPWFDGNSENTPTETYAWTGAENASTSTREVRDPIMRPQTEEEYEATITPLVRHLHDVVCISGPLEVQTQRSADGVHWGRLVEFTLYAGKPFLYGETVDLPLNLAAATVMQDAPFNIVVTPSAELAGPQVITARNLSKNPSVEANANNWSVRTSVVSGTSPGAYMTEGRSTELAASGQASFRARVLGNGSTTVSQSEAIVDLTQLVNVSGQPAGTRVSFSMWGAVLAIGGANVSQLLGLGGFVHWLNSAGTVISATGDLETTDTTRFGGRVFSFKSVLPPAGAVSARCTIRARFKWGSSATAANNSDIRIYADALALTIP